MSTSTSNIKWQKEVHPNTHMAIDAASKQAGSWGNTK
jgi:hypothetical protein